jgi:protein-tyrosine phosphatase
MKLYFVLIFLGMEKIKILFICMGNICRSPTAEGVFAKLIDERGLSKNFKIDSAGTHAYHISEPPDRRAQQAALNRKIKLKHLRARKVKDNDYDHFDYLLVMDHDNYRNMMHNCPEEHVAKVQYFLEYAPHLNTQNVPDPYYGGKHGFEQVLDMVEAASEGFLSHLHEEGELE